MKKKETIWKEYDHPIWGKSGALENGSSIMAKILRDLLLLKKQKKKK